MDTNIMNQLCRVCGEPAAGFHFGAFTCEGCKSFFGRTYNNLSSISECKNNGECVINKKNRTSCKACRLRKCLLVGMSKSGSRYGRRSNWFKIHCLLQEQGGGSGGAPTPKWDEDNNNVKKDPPPIWRLPIPGVPLFGFPPPIPPFFLPRGLSLPPPPTPTPPTPMSPMSPPLPQHHHPPPPPPPPPHPHPSSLDILRNLGPVQDTPMDLRLNKDVPDDPRPNLSPHPIATQSDRKTPLDLTCVKT